MSLPGRHGHATARLCALTAPALNSMAERDAIIIVPLGATEQHGPHLPVMVISPGHRGGDAQCGKVAQGRPSRIGDADGVDWFSEHHMELGGTITIDFSTFHGLVRGIVRSWCAMVSDASACSTAMAEILLRSLWSSAS